MHTTFSFFHGFFLCGFLDIFSYSLKLKLCVDIKNKKKNSYKKYGVTANREKDVKQKR